MPDMLRSPSVILRSSRTRLHPVARSSILRLCLYPALLTSLPLGHLRRRRPIRVLGRVVETELVAALGSSRRRLRLQIPWVSVESARLPCQCYVMIAAF